MYLKGLILFKKKHIILLIIFSLGFFNSPVFPGYSSLKSGIANLKQETKQAEYNKHISRGDSLMNLEKYDEAMIEYQKASDLMPLEEYPRLKMQAIETLTRMKQIEERKEASKEDLRDLTKKDGVDVSDKEILAEQEEARETAKRDSLRQAVLNKYEETLTRIKKTEDDQEISKVYKEIADTLKNLKAHSNALGFYRQSLEIEEKRGNKENAAVILEDIADIYLDSGLYKSSINSYEKSMGLKEDIGDERGVSNALSNIGNVYETTYDFNKAINYYEKSAEVKDNIDDKEGLSVVMDNIGNLYYKQRFLEKSIDSYKKSAELNEQLNMQDNLGSNYNKLGVAYYKMGNYDEAERYYEKSLEVKQETGNKKDASMTYNNLGNINLDKSKYKKAITYYEKSLELKDDIDYTYGQAVSLHNMGNAYRQLNIFTKAAEHFESSKKICEENNFEELLARNIKVLSELYFSINATDKANEYKELLAKSEYQDVDINEPVTESQITGEMGESEKVIKFLTEEVLRQKEMVEQQASERERENKINSQRLRIKNLQIKRQRIIVGSLSIVIALILVALFLFYRQIVQKKKANVVLTDKNRVISKQQKLITDNMQSASVIQKAAMPPDNFINKELTDFFVLNLPKDIVSGDFYWMDKRDDRIFLAVADCTGHGVQGAVVSMLGIALLNEIVNKSYSKKPGEILDQLSVKIKDSLHQSGDIDQIREGMDIVLLKINKKINKIEFAGANNPVYIVRGEDIIEQKGDRNPIGYYSKGTLFETRNLEIKKGDSLYMFSDGYVDQLGGESLKKFLPRRFRAILTEINNKPMKERKEILMKEFNEWRGDYQQVDDIMVLGLKI
ncbi:MAG: tetratricopeptide repeat protein [Bacteroidales bacterium]|nr:MAG: tetratricopeptide repeat protein [Bacteroidales bacterium]